jgi:hypothetical protein
MTARLFGIQEFFVGVIQQVKAKGDVIAHSSQTDAIAVFRFNPKAIAFPSHSAQVNAIALAAASEHAFEAVIKFSCSAIANPSKKNAITFFRFSRKAIASPSYFEETSLRLGFLMSTQPPRRSRLTPLIAFPVQAST